VRPRTAGKALVDQLAAEGVQWAFGVPGESFLDALDSFRDRQAPRFVTCRHEGGAALAAEAASKLAGRAQVCMVSRGPGAMNAALGVHVASQDSTPVLFLVGQVPRRQSGLGAFQELDVVAAFGAMTKFAETVSDPDRVPETVARALRVAAAGRPGPTVVALPEDVLGSPTTAPIVERAIPARCEPSAGAVAEVAALLGEAKRPVIVVGGMWAEDGCEHLVQLVEAWQVPVVSSFRRQDLLDNDHPCYAGTLGTATDPHLIERIGMSDLLVVLGPTLDAITTAGYSLVSAPRPAQRLVHVYPSPTELGRVYRPDVAVVAVPGAFAAAARKVPAGRARRSPAWLASAREDYVSWSTPVARTTPGAPGTVDLTAVMAQLQGLLPRDAIVTNGAGNYTGWLQRYLRYHGYGTQLAPVCGTMGYGVPAALAAALAKPSRRVVAFAGDGCFMMTGQELATAAQERAGFVTVVVDNGCLGTIRAHQEARYPGRPIGTVLQSPDFAKLCEAYGGHGWTVSSPSQFRPAWEEALRAAELGEPALLRLMVDPARLSVAGEARA